MVSLGNRADFILERIKNKKHSSSFIKKDVEDILLDVNGHSWIAKSKFAIQCLHGLANSAVLCNKTSSKGDPTLKEFAATVVLCYNNVFDRGHDTSETEESQIGRYLYKILYDIMDIDYAEGLVISDLITKMFSRSYRTPPWPHVGSIVHNSSIILWNYSLKPELPPTDAMRLRLNAIVLLSLAGDPKYALKSCERALSSAQLYCSALDKNRGNDVSDLRRFTDVVLGKFSSLMVSSLDETPAAFESIVKLIHLTVNQHQKLGRMEEIDEFLATVNERFDGFRKIIRSFSSCTGILSIGFDVLALTSLMTKITLKKSIVLLDGKEFDKVITSIATLKTGDFTHFDNNCFTVAVNSLRIRIHSLIGTSLFDSSIVLALSPCFHRISKWMTSMARCAASISAANADSVYILEHLCFYQSTHMKVFQYADTVSLKSDLQATVSTLRCFFDIIELAPNRTELVVTVVKRCFNVASVLFERKMFAEVMDVVHPHAPLFIDSFALVEKNGAEAKDAFWKQMTMLVHCMKKCSKYEEALNLLAVFLSKGYTAMDKKAVVLWTNVKLEAKIQNVDSVQAVSLTKLLTSLAPTMSGSYKQRIATVLAEEVTMMRECSTPADEFYSALSDLLQFTDDSFLAATALVQMGRLLLTKQTLCDVDGRTVSGCCNQALGMLIDGGRRRRDHRVRCLVVQAKFVSYLGRLCRIYDDLENKMNSQRARHDQSVRDRKEKVERMSAADAAAEADGLIQLVQDEFGSFQPSTVWEELQSATELDSFLEHWTALVDGGRPEMMQFSSVLLKDLKLAAEIYCNAGLYGREIVVRRLCVKLTVQGKFSAAEHVLESSRLACALARQGLVDAADQVLRAIDKNKLTTASVKNGGVSPLVSLQAPIMLELVYGELRLMQDRVIEGFDNLCRAIELIEKEKKYKCMLLLKGRALLLLAKYMELASPPSPPLCGSSDGNSFSSCSNPLRYVTDALRFFVGILRTCGKDKESPIELINMELVGCLLDCGLQMSRRFYDVGLLREARYYLKEQMTWSQTFFCASFTARTLLLSAEMDLAVGDVCGCQTKLNTVRSIVESVDKGGQFMTDALLRPTSPMPSMETPLPVDADFLSEPKRSDLVLAKLQPASQLKSSPFLPRGTSSSSVDLRLIDLARCDCHSHECGCSWCDNVHLLRIRAEFMMISFRLTGIPPFYGSTDFFKAIRSLSLKEKKLLLKASVPVESSLTPVRSPISHIDVGTCWTLSRLAGSLFTGKDVKRACHFLELAKKLLSKIQVGVGQLNYVQATLIYQDCLAALLVETRRNDLDSVSKLCEPAWSRSFAADSFGIERLPHRFQQLTVCETVGAPEKCFKTPKSSKVLRPRTANGNMATKKNAQCAAPVKKSVKSLYEHYFDDVDHDHDHVEDADDSVKVIKVTGRKNLSSVPPQPEHSSTGSRRVIPVITISDKENSDVDDVTSPTGATKRKISAVTVTGRSLRSKTKVTILDFGASLAADDAGSSSAQSQVKRSKATSKRGAKTKCLFAIPSEASDDDVETRKPRTRKEATKTSASDLQEMERFRTNSPTKVVQMAGGWRTTNNTAMMDVDEYLEDDGDLAIGGRRRFDVDDVIERLDKALKLVERHPRMPLYGDLNLLLALCKGDGRSRGAKGNPWNGIGHALESVGVSFRHYADLRLTVISSDLSCVHPKAEERRRIMSCKDGSMLASSCSDTELQRMADRLPKGWVVCQMNTLPTSLSGNAANPHLIVTRLERSRRPIIVKIENQRNSEGVSSFLSEFEKIMAASSDNMRIRVKEDWWNARKALDARLKTYLSSLEDAWLGTWKCLFLGRRSQREDEQRLRDATREVVHQLRSSLDVSSPDEDLVEMMLDCWPRLKTRENCWRRALSHVCRFADMSDDDDAMSKAFSVFDVQSARLWTFEDVQRHVCVLILDKVLHHLPWENMPILLHQAVTRMPSIHALLGHVSLHLDGHLNESSSPIRLPSVNTDNAYFVLNPSKDLMRTQITFEPIFKELKWPGLSDQPPTATEWTDGLTNKDLFVYCGHGSGSQFIHGEAIEKVACRAATILMGCSSALLRNIGGPFEPFGVPYNYLLAGCPYVMGNLWNVTDKDIDRILAALLRIWIPGAHQKDDSIADALTSARTEAVLHSLIGAATVAYGIPVYSLKMP